MERASFLVEKTGDRIDCLLNPENVVVRRLAGIQHRHSSSGPITGGNLKDDPLLYTGGGMTEIFLDLLFDTSLTNDATTSEDVRDLTLPLAKLAEGVEEEDNAQQLSIVRFVWGKKWNVLGVVAALAERLEYFNADGAPQRSWLRMRFVRVSSSSQESEDNWSDDVSPTELPDADDVPLENLKFYEMTGTGQDGGQGVGSTERIDEIARRVYGNPLWWRRIANFNNIDDPWKIAPGTLLSIPPDSAAGGSA
ncbi:LysM peptidoglycan-binding domain-containing protein [Acidobacterium sp. S8]|uniref:CIS tube protein n=1 Tax=Acidobacterium sp. S8 TaxID=1641854 RepID=UPI00131BA423|nr:LysM peptidoglycan-binding domain-containing protein [Acidobacterium sp. S8]